MRPIDDSMWTPEPNTGCWIWSGKLNDHGYGRTTRRDDGRSRDWYAHRLMWLLVTGLDPGDLNVLHRCDFPACINPAHLFLGTQVDNNRDRGAKGRTARGSAQGAAKLSEKDVAQIRAAVARGEKQDALARRYGVSGGTLSFAVNRLTWRHVL